MWFTRKVQGQYDHLNPELGPPEGSEIRLASTPLLPTMGRILSRDGVEGDVVWLSVSRTFESCPPSTPWAMTIGLLKELDRGGITTLPSAFISHSGAIPGLEQASAGLRAARARPIVVTALLTTLLMGASSESFDRLWGFHLINSFDGLPDVQPQCLGRHQPERKLSCVQRDVHRGV